MSKIAKSVKMFFGCVLAIMVAVVCPVGLTYGAEISYAREDWRIVAIPADLDGDPVIRLIKGYAQPIYFAFQAAAANRRDHQVTLEFTLPEGAEFVYSNIGWWEMEHERTMTKEKERLRVKDTFLFPHHMWQGNPGSRVGAEWRHYTLILKISEEAPEHQDLRVDFFIGDRKIDSYVWPVHLSALPEKGARLTQTRLGLWDYELRRSPFAAGEILEFLSAVGINYVQGAIGDGALADEFSITFGGQVHHGAFRNPEHPNITAAGGVAGFSCPQAVIEEGPDVLRKAIQALVKSAQRFSGLATLNFEPTGLSGFSERSIRAFQKEYGVTDDDFQAFREEYSRLRHGMRLTDDPKLLGIFKKWVEFRSWQVAGYFRVIAEELNRIDPAIRFENTGRRNVGIERICTLAIGADNSTMAKYLDTVMPQLYQGYCGASAKLVALLTRNWRQRVNYLNPEGKLIPLLMIRYAGASVHNCPRRMRQQTLAVLAEGGEGVVYYFPQQMDAPYWLEVAEMTHDIAFSEDFYQQGTRNDNLLVPIDMPLGKQEIRPWPGYPEMVINPDWHHTVHELGNKVLLTLFNFNQANDILFRFEKVPSLEVIDIRHARHVKEYCCCLGERLHPWLVPPKTVAFIKFLRPSP